MSRSKFTRSTRRTVSLC